MRNISPASHDLVAVLLAAFALSAALPLPAALLVAAAPAPVQDAGMFRGNLAHTGVYSGPGVRILTGVKWKFHTEGRVIASPAVVAGVVYFGSTDGNLYAVDRDTGAARWTFPTGGRVTSSPAVSDGRVYFESYDGIFYAVDVSTGTSKWTFKTGGERRYAGRNLHGHIPAGETMPDPFDLYLSSPAVWKQTVYFGSGDGHIYALDAISGRLRWKYRTGDVVHASPAIADGTLYIGSWDSYFYALDATTGGLRWRFKTGEDPEIHNQVGIQSSAAVADGVVYFGCRDSHLYALDARTGEKKWAYGADGAWINTSPAVRDGKVYLATADERTFLELDAASGAKRFAQQFSWYFFASPAITSDMAYVANWDGRLFGIDLQTHTIAWTFQTEASRQNLAKYTKADGSMNFRAARSEPGAFYDDLVVALDRIFTMGSFLSSPVVVDGVIFIGSTDGNLYAIR